LFSAEIEIKIAAGIEMRGDFLETVLFGGLDGSDQRLGRIGARGLRLLSSFVLFAARETSETAYKNERQREGLNFFHMVE